MVHLTYIDLTELPAGLASMFTISEWVAGVLLTIGFLLGVLLPFTILTKGDIGYPHMILTLFVVIAATVLEWIDPWILLLGVILIAIGFGVKLRDVG